MREINVDILHENLFKNKPLLAFSNENNYPKWKRAIRQKYTELLGLDIIKQNECPLDIEIEEIKEFDTYTRYRYTFKSENDVVVPCYLLIPKKPHKKWPICICLQGHTTGFHISIGEPRHERDFKDVLTSDFGLEAIKNGYAALCIEQRGMGERTTKLSKRYPALTCACYYPAMTALLLGRTLIGERVWDVHKAIDSLAYFSKHLKMNDITIVGNSGGGTASYYTACFEKRIKTIASSSAICTYRDSIGDMWHCSCNYIPQIARYMDMGELACLIAPRKLFIFMGENDPIFPLSGTKEVFSVIQDIYKKEGAADNCKLFVYPNREHYFDKNMVFGELKNSRKKPLK